jgi:hypothetical protein
MEAAIAAGIGLAAGAVAFLVLNSAFNRLHVSGSVAVSLLAVIITVIGWAVSQRAQRRLFLHQVKNAARNEIIAAIRNSQNALGALQQLLFAISIQPNGNDAWWRDAYLEFEKRWK